MAHAPHHLRKLAARPAKRPTETGLLGLIASDKTVPCERGEDSGLCGQTGQRRTAAEKIFYQTLHWDLGTMEGGRFLKILERFPQKKVKFSFNFENEIISTCLNSPF